MPEVLDRLTASFGPAPPPPVTDPWEQVLWENVAYMADDDRRAAAFALLRERVGLSPEQVRDAPSEALQEIARAGILPEVREQRLREAAEVVLEKCGGDVSAAISGGGKGARRLLRCFPGIGAPGADKILLFSRQEPVFALESNGLRVLVRCWEGAETGAYDATYRRVCAQAGAELREADLAGDPYDRLIGAYQLLRRHGQSICRRSTPECGRCPLSEGCAYAQGRRGGMDG
jgi:endonuclease III